MSGELLVMVSCAVGALRRTAAHSKKSAGGSFSSEGVSSSRVSTSLCRKKCTNGQQGTLKKGEASVLHSHLDYFRKIIYCNFSEILSRTLRVEFQRVPGK